MVLLKANFLHLDKGMNSFVTKDRTNIQNPIIFNYEFIRFTINVISY